jgi:hypothetical protein
LTGFLIKNLFINKIVAGSISILGSLGTLFIPGGGGGPGAIISQIKPFIRRYAGRR